MKNKLLRRFFVVLSVVCMSFFSLVSGVVSASAAVVDDYIPVEPPVITDVSTANYFNPSGLAYGTVTYRDTSTNGSLVVVGDGVASANSITYTLTHDGLTSKSFVMAYDVFSKEGVFRDIPFLSVDDRPYYIQFNFNSTPWDDWVELYLMVQNPNTGVIFAFAPFSPIDYVNLDSFGANFICDSFFSSDVLDSYDGFNLYFCIGSSHSLDLFSEISFSSFYLRSYISGSSFISDVPFYYNFFDFGYDVGFTEGYNQGYNEGYNIGLEDGGGIGSPSYEDGYNAGLAFSKYGIFYNSKIAYRVLDSEGNIRIPYQLAPLKLTVLNNGLDLTNLGTYLTNLYSDTSYQFDIRIIFGLETSISQLSIRASGQTSFLGNYQLSLGLSEPGKQLIGVSNPDYTYPASFIQDIYGDFKLDFSSNWSNFYDSSIVVTSLTDWRIPNAEVLRNLVLFNLSADYNNGYKVGYDDGFEEGTSEVDSLIDSAYEDGKKEGNSIGYKDGYGAGLRVGYESTSLNDNIKTFVFSVFETPFQVLESFFTLDFVGFDLSSVIKFLITILIVGFVLKLVL